MPDFQSDTFKKDIRTIIDAHYKIYASGLSNDEKMINQTVGAIISLILQEEDNW